MRSPRTSILFLLVRLGPCLTHGYHFAPNSARGSPQFPLIRHQHSQISDIPLLPSLHVLLAPSYFSQFTEDKRGNGNDQEVLIPNGINVTLFFKASCFPPAAALLSLQLSYGPTPTARYDGDAISATDVDGDLPLHYVDVYQAEDDGEIVRTWYPSRPPMGNGSDRDLAIRFFAPARHVDNTTLVGPRIDLRRDVGGGLVGQGMGFIPVPPPAMGKENWVVTVEWDLSKAPNGTRGACSFGDDAGIVSTDPSVVLSRAVGTLQAVVSSAVFAVGMLKRYPEWDTHTSSQDDVNLPHPERDLEPLFAVYWLGSPPFDMAVLTRQAKTAYRAVANFFRPNSPSAFRVFIRRVEDGMGGTGATDSFLIEWSNITADQMTYEFILNLLAHETVHEYALLEGRVADGKIEVPEALWYDEGIANYYSAIAASRKSPFHADRHLLLWQLNCFTQNYYTSPVVHMPWLELTDHFWDNVYNSRGPYTRGFIYLAAVNGQIRSATGGARSLDDVSRELYRRRINGEPHGLREWHSLVGGLIGVDAERRGYEQLLKGDLILPSENSLFDLGLRLVRDDAERFDLGFDSNSLRSTSMRISGLVNGSRAERAGVREGDRVVEAWMVTLAAYELSGMMRIVVQRQNEYETIEWWPRGYDKVETWKWVDDSELEEL